MTVKHSVPPWGCGALTGVPPTDHPLRTVCDPCTSGLLVWPLASRSSAVVSHDAASAVHASLPCTQCEILDVGKYSDPTFGPF